MNAKPHRHTHTHAAVQMGRTLAAHFCSTFSTSLSRLRQIRRERPKVLRPSGGMLLGCSKTLGPRSPRPYGPEWMSCRLLLSEQLSERLRSVLQESLTLPKALRQPQNQPVGFMVIICYHSPKKKTWPCGEGRSKSDATRNNTPPSSVALRTNTHTHAHAFIPVPGSAWERTPFLRRGARLSFGHPVVIPPPASAIAMKLIRFLSRSSRRTPGRRIKKKDQNKTQTSSSDRTPQWVGGVGER